MGLVDKKGPGGQGTAHKALFSKNGGPTLDDNYGTRFVPSIAAIDSLSDDVDLDGTADGHMSPSEAPSRVSFKSVAQHAIRRASQPDDPSDVQLQSMMMENYNEYVLASNHSPHSPHLDETNQRPQPRYLSETFSSRAPDYSAQAEGERLSNTFCAGSHWTLKKLPPRFEPGSIRIERKQHIITNLLGKNPPPPLGEMF